MAAGRRNSPDTSAPANVAGRWRGRFCPAYEALDDTCWRRLSASKAQSIVALGRAHVDAGVRHRSRWRLPMPPVWAAATAAAASIAAALALVLPDPAEVRDSSRSGSRQRPWPQRACRQRAATQRCRDPDGQPRHHGVLVLQGVTMDVRFRIPLLSLLVLAGCEVEIAGQAHDQPSEGEPAFTPLPTPTDLETRTFRPRAPRRGHGHRACRTVRVRGSTRGTRRHLARSWRYGAISVRETPDNLDKIAPHARPVRRPLPDPVVPAPLSKSW